MKTIIKLIVAAVIVNATFRAVTAAWDYYELKDAVSQLLTFGDRTSTHSIQSTIVKRAQELNLPLATEDLVVHRQGTRTWAEGSYVQAIELFPNYRYPMTFSFLIDAYSLNPGIPEDPQ